MPALCLMVLVQSMPVSYGKAYSYSIPALIPSMNSVVQGCPHQVQYWSLRGFSKITSSGMQNKS